MKMAMAMPSQRGTQYKMTGNFIRGINRGNMV